MIMKKQFIIGLLLAFAVFLSACGSNPPAVIENVVNTPVATSAPTMTNTPDPCGSENREAEVQKIHKYMREFDDASSLAASRPREQLADAIAELQRIRRESEDQPTPSCLVDLKTYQISHMNSVINTLMAFMSSADQQAVDQGIALAREQHDQYTLELARLLGLTIEPATVVPPPAETP
jgi:hypothetical protein